MTRLSLADLGIADPSEDPGTHWHPRADKAEAWDEAGHLRDLDDDQVAAHAEKPEADEQYDGVQRRRRENRSPGAAEDSGLSEDGAV